MMPSLALTYIICTSGGLYPSREPGSDPTDFEGIIGEVRQTALNFVPTDWLPCQGQALPISTYPTLYAVLGVAYGGDGKTTFNLPDLGGRVAIGAGTGPGLTSRQVGAVMGEAAVALTVGQIPPHTHQLTAWQAQQTAQTVKVPTASTGLAGNGAPLYTRAQPTHGRNPVDTRRARDASNNAP
ncbi:MAG: tail fiber protein [Azospirillaceae bacterium]|nr:tail fiber protein [Azospirillaceae bacterium]